MLKRWKQKLSKPVLFGLYGAIGCSIAALLLGEALLALTKLPPSIERSPQAIVLLIDASGSMSGGKLTEVKAAATSFVQRQDLSKDSFAVIGFGSRVRVGTSLTSDLETIESAIASLADGGGTNMALGLQTAAAQLRSSDFTRSILLFTDGQANLRSTLAAAQSSQSQNINLIAVGTGDADTNFLTQLTGDSSLVFYASSGQFDQAFRAAEKVIYSKQLVESGDSGDYGLVYGALRVGGWTGLLALGTSLALIVGQNDYLRRRLLTPQEGTIGTLGGLSAGLAAGAIAQLAFTPVANISLLAILGQIVGWAILGTLLGGGMSFFVPNLQRRRALQAGAVGGSAGALGFILAASWAGDLAGRLLGAAILGFFIGLAIALIERIGRQAWLVVHWNAKEQTQISLGSEPIIIGSSDKAHIYLSKAKGFPAITAKIFVEAGTIVMQYDERMQERNMKILRHELVDGDRRKLGDLMLEVKTTAANFQ